jgi:hypothetical protein
LELEDSAELEAAEERTEDFELGKTEEETTEGRGEEQTSQETREDGLINVQTAHDQVDMAVGNTAGRV